MIFIEEAADGRQGRTENGGGFLSSPEEEM